MGNGDRSVPRLGCKKREPAKIVANFRQICSIFVNKPRDYWSFKLTRDAISMRNRHHGTPLLQPAVPVQDFPENHRNGIVFRLRWPADFSSNSEEFAIFSRLPSALEI